MTIAAGITLCRFLVETPRWGDQGVSETHQRQERAIDPLGLERMGEVGTSAVVANAV